MTVWHLDPETIRRYAQGSAPPQLAASAEAHLIACADCRAALAAHVDARRVDTIWHEVADRVDAPRRGWPERALSRLGVGEATARLVAATPTLRAPWLLAVAGVLVLTALAAQADERLLRTFLVVAPLGPLAGVAVAFAGGLDPTREIGLAAPYSALRLLLIRTAAVLSVTVPIVAVAVVAAAWVLVTVPIAVAGHVDAAFGPGVQIFWLAAAAAGAVWLATARDTVAINLGRTG
jgi:hypothetical protein